MFSVFAAPRFNFSRREKCAKVDQNWSTRSREIAWGEFPPSDFSGTSRPILIYLSAFFSASKVEPRSRKEREQIFISFPRYRLGGNVTRDTLVIDRDMSRYCALNCAVTAQPMTLRFFFCDETMSWEQLSPLSNPWFLSNSKS